VPASPVALVVHGHFYQPPRENPWTDELPREPSAAPYHDWNGRIHAECYRSNAYARIFSPDARIESIVNSYDRLSFNFGPTLARWIERHDPHVMARLRAADEAQRRRLGAGGAIAQAYAHAILPLCDPADRRTQVLWGLADFERRFGHPAEGIWLPETAVSPETLMTLIDAGVEYTILAPEQIDGVRASDQDTWEEVDRDSIDTGRAYVWRHPDGSGRSIALAVFDGPLSRAVAFGDAATRADLFLDAVKAAAERSASEGQRLVVCASDGELWGHHKKFADLTLAFATHVEAERRGLEVTNLGAYLKKHPPVWEARLASGPDGEGTAWSCSHGVGRWIRDCGCHMGSGMGWNQAWRGPLRLALDRIREAASEFYEDAAGQLLIDPWGARDAYGTVVDAPIPERDAVLAQFATPELEAGGDEARDRARLLLELQRATLLMYASCGWFFDDIAGLEASLVIRFGAHAMDLLQTVGGQAPTEEVLDLLARAKSNRPEEGTGADVFRRMSGQRVTAVHAAAGAAFEALAAPFGEPDDVRAAPGFDVTLRGSLDESPEGAGLFAGTAEVRQRRTGATDEMAVVASAGPRATYEAEIDEQRVTLDELSDDARAALVISGLPALLSELDDPRVARLMLVGARQLPPDSETPAGVSRRALLSRAVLILLGEDDGVPGNEKLHVATQLLELLALPQGSPERRAIEERTWALIARGRPNAALRALADKLGFAAHPAPLTS
jgi:alpha-amylase/alpha-mannosidase (GH57 family)